MSKKGIVLVNLGTPDAPELKQVRKYLTQFLNDRRVIDIPWILRKILVNLIIIPFRAKKSTRLYQRLWTEKGSPLLFHLTDLVNKLKQTMPENVEVFGAMRYGSPALRDILKEVETGHFSEVIILPLFPQYASSTTGSINEVVLKTVDKWSGITKLNLIKLFYDHPAFINAYVQRMSTYKPEQFDHILFSYHGLPLRQVTKVHKSIQCGECNCEEQVPNHGTFCYKTTCYATTRFIAEGLKLNKERYSVTFQSRLTRNWLSPFTDESIVQLAENGVKKLLVIAPSFVADCLETTVELGEDYKKLFLESGGESFVLADSLNSSDVWVDAIKDIVNV